MPFTRSHFWSIACGTIFHHIEEDIQDTDQTNHLANELYPDDMPERPNNGPAKPPKKRGREEDDALTKVQKFRQIQLISTYMLGLIHNRWRVILYELRKNEWYDCGISFSAGILVNVSCP
jgi:hypothetical protein